MRIWFYLSDGRYLNSYSVETQSLLMFDDAKHCLTLLNIFINLKLLIYFVLKTIIINSSLLVHKGKVKNKVH